MQKAISGSRRPYKYAKRNKLLFSFLTCVFFFPKKFPRTSFLMIQMTEEQLSNHFYVYITCFGIQVEKCSRKVVEKCLYSQYEQETRIKGRGREHLLWDFEAKSRDKNQGCSRSKQNPTNNKPTRLSSSRGV